MLVEEKSRSVETVEEEPPFAIIRAGNANRILKQKEVQSILTRRVYHIRAGIANIILC